MYANILVEYGAKALDQTFTYIIPDILKDNLGGKTLLTEALLQQE